MVPTERKAADEYPGYQVSRVAASPPRYQLAVALRPAPTRQHYDPEELHAPVASDKATVDTLSVHHPFACPGEYRVVLGRIRLRDRKDKAVSFFSFGGELNIQTSATRTYCALVSPAPIIELHASGSFMETLAFRVEALLARRRAAAGHCRGAFEERLVRLDPLMLYIACLVELERRAENLPCNIDQSLHTFYSRVRAALRELQDMPEYPTAVPELGELL